MKKIFFLILLTHISLLACSCIYSPLKKSYLGADLIFIGKFISDTLDYSVDYGVLNNFETLKMYKGSSNDYIQIVSGYGGGDCGYRFMEGEEYLIYAYEDDGVFSTSICTRTCHLDDSKVDLVYFKHLPEALSKTVMTGKVSYFVDNTINQYNLPSFKNLRFTIKNDSISYNVNTDSNGVYYIENVLPGNYDVEIDKKLNLAIKKDFYGELKIELAETHDYNFVVTNINAISGIVKDQEGNLVASGFIQLIPEQFFIDYEDKFLYKTYDCWLRNDGKFLFRNIPNGKYYLGINMDQEPWHVNPYSRTFYKNAENKESAKKIVLNGNNNYSDIEIIVKKVYKEYTIKCQLVTKDGKYWNDAFVSLKKKDEKGGWDFIAHGMKLNKKGEYKINTVEDTEGWIIVEPRNIKEYYEKGLYVKKPAPIKIEPNKNYDDIRITIEFSKR